MASFGMEQIQKASQIQTQKMSQNQIMTLKLLSMNSQDLRNEIYAQIEENPALEIVKDPFSDGPSTLKRKNSSYQNNVRTGSVSAAGQLEADTYQQMLESSPDNRETLQEHLLHQLNMLTLSEQETELCQKLIGNLDEKGYHILAPVSLINGTSPEKNLQLLNKCLSIIHKFEPAGVCVQNVTESLLVQAEQKEKAPRLALFFLNNHLEMLSVPSAERVQKKISAWQQEQKKLSFRSPESNEPQDIPSLTEIENSIRFIQSLDPYPARNFHTQETHFIRPDVYVHKVEGLLEKENPDSGLIFCDNSSYFRVVIADDTVPQIQISPDFENKDISQKLESGEQKKFVKTQISSAQSFINNLNFREQIILRSCALLVQSQREFFKKGPSFLIPLTQKKFAEILGVHESSVSRLADSKFIRCSWGTFPIKYFFTSAIAKKSVPVFAKTEEELSQKTFAQTQDGMVSSNTIKIEIQKILDSQKPGEKRLSDQKIADLLAAKGFQVARRTVAKYRSQLNINSSYNR